MDPQKQREIASKGGKAAHQKGTAHEFTREEARIAGRKGGAASRARRSGGGNASQPDNGGMAGGGEEQMQPGPSESQERTDMNEMGGMGGMTGGEENGGGA